MHDWTDPTLPAIADEWGLSVFSPDALELQLAVGVSVRPLELRMGLSFVAIRSDLSIGS
jgi:hypothetical protein